MQRSFRFHASHQEQKAKCPPSEGCSSVMALAAWAASFWLWLRWSISEADTLRWGGKEMRDDPRAGPRLPRSLSNTPGRRRASRPVARLRSPPDTLGSPSAPGCTAGWLLPLPDSCRSSSCPPGCSRKGVSGREDWLSVLCQSRFLFPAPLPTRVELVSPCSRRVPCVRPRQYDHTAAHPQLLLNRGWADVSGFAGHSLSWHPPCTCVHADGLLRGHHSHTWRQVTPPDMPSCSAMNAPGAASLLRQSWRLLFHLQTDWPKCLQQQSTSDSSSNPCSSRSSVTSAEGKESPTAAMAAAAAASVSAERAPLEGSSAMLCRDRGSGLRKLGRFLRRPLPVRPAGACEHHEADTAGNSWCGRSLLAEPSHRCPHRQLTRLSRRPLCAGKHCAKSCTWPRSLRLAVPPKSRPWISWSQVVGAEQAESSSSACWGRPAD